MEAKQAQLIRSETTIGEIMLKYPQLADAMVSFGMKMTGCGTPYQEQLKTVAMAVMRSSDVTIEKNGLKVVVDPASAEALKGAIIDYVETLNRSGFKVDNPNAHAVCSCGSSFG